MDNPPPEDEHVFSPMPPMKPESHGTIVLEMPEEEYHASEHVGSSSLKIIMQSPADYKAALTMPNKDTKSTTLGTAVHCALLEPKEFRKRYALQTQNWGPRNKGEGYQRWKELKEQAKASGKIALPYEEAEKIRAIKLAGRQHEPLGIITSDGDAEVSAFLTCPETGTLYKARADWLTSDGFIWDLKTTVKPVDHYNISQTIYHEGYHFQAAHYKWVFEQIGVDIQGYGWIFVSTGTPYPHIVTKRCSKKLMEAGEADHKYARETLASCRESGRWHGLPQTTEEIDLPEYAERNY